MMRGAIARIAAGAWILGTPAVALAQMGWAPGSEIVGQPVQVETDGVVNTVYFDAGGTARILTPAGTTVPANWTAGSGQLCLSTPSARECWPYAQAFQAGQQITLTSTCNSASRWTALGINPLAPPVEQGSGERG